MNLRDRFSKLKIKETRKDLYRIENKKKGKIEKKPYQIRKEYF